MKTDAVRILCVAAVSGVTLVAGCIHKFELAPSGTAVVLEKTDAHVHFSRIPLGPGVVVSPVLMVWRDPATGNFQSCMLPQEMMMDVTAGSVADSRNLPVPPRADTRVIAVAD